MRRILRLAAASAAILPLGRAAAEEPPTTYVMPERAVWKVGEATTRTKTATQEQRVLVTMGGSVFQDDKTKDTTSYETVTRVEAVDDDGAVRDALVHFASWKREVNGEADESLAGAHVRLTGTGPARKVEVLASGSRATAAARAWLETEFGAAALVRDAERARVHHPGRAVAVGETWSPDLDRLRKTFPPNFEFDPTRGSGKNVLEAVDAGSATWSSEVSLATKELRSPRGNLAWTEGGTVESTAKARKPLDPAKHDEASESRVAIRGKAQVMGADVEFSLAATVQSETKSGGTMPDLPKADAAEPPSK
jgi:hypothetical protein